MRLKNPKDGFEMRAFHVRPGDARRGGLVLMPGLDGLSAELRAIADQFAAEGYEVLGPDLFERFGQTDPADAADPTAIDLMSRTEWGLGCISDMQAAVDALEGPVFALGFSFGGGLAWLAAARCSGLAAAACFSGGQIVRHLDEGLRCPTILHFGRRDALIPEADVQRITEAHPDLPVWIYDAGHDFVRSHDPKDADAARLAMLRTRQLFMRSAGGRAEMGG